MLNEHGQDLPDHVYRTLMCVADYADSETGKRAWPGTERLAKQRRMSERQIRTHLRAAEDSGWLVQHSRGRKRGTKGYASEYWLNVPDKLVEALGLTQGDAEDIEAQPEAQSSDWDSQPEGIVPLGDFPTGSLIFPNRKSDAPQPEVQDFHPSHQDHLIQSTQSSARASGASESTVRADSRDGSQAGGDTSQPPSSRDQYEEILGEFVSVLAVAEGVSEADARKQALLEVQGIGGYGAKIRQLQRSLESLRRRAA